MQCINPHVQQHIYFKNKKATTSDVPDAVVSFFAAQSAAPTATSPA
jgi:hypothetical protein